MIGQRPGVGVVTCASPLLAQSVSDGREDRGTAADEARTYEHLDNTLPKTAKMCKDWKALA